jgi:hypothetical protein
MLDRMRPDRARRSCGTYNLLLLLAAVVPAYPKSLIQTSFLGP